MYDFWQEFDIMNSLTLGRGFFRFPMAKGLEAQIGGGYGRYQGKDFADNYGVETAKYVTDIIPIDFRLLLHLAETDKRNLIYLSALVDYIIKLNIMISQIL